MKFNCFYFFLMILTQLLTQTSMHGAQTSTKTIIGRRSMGRSLAVHTDTMFKNGRANHVKKKESRAAVIAHMTVAGKPTIITHPWYTPSLVYWYARSRALVMRGTVLVSSSCGNVLANPNCGSNNGIHFDSTRCREYL